MKIFAVILSVAFMVCATISLIEKSISLGEWYIIFLLALIFVDNVKDKQQ